jgi:uncharacterized damage-inducible protein DinB
LNERLAVTRMNGLSGEPLIADIFKHVLSHGDHHRGQLAAYAAVKGYYKPDIDYMNFCIIHKL